MQHRMKSFAAAAALLIALSGCIVADDDPPGTRRMGGRSPGAGDNSVLVDCAKHGFPQQNSTLAMPLLPAEVNATLVTNKGDINIVLYAQLSPITVCNFVQYALEDFYVDTVFHRICPHVIQAGGFTNPYASTMKPGAHPPIKNEANVSELRNYKYTFGMARTANPDSASTHFFINNRDNNYLDFDSTRAGVAPGYAVFANITSGQAVADAIAQSTTVPEPDDVTSQTGQVPDGCGNKNPAPNDQTVFEKIRIDA